MSWAVDAQLENINNYQNFFLCKAVKDALLHRLLVETTIVGLVAQLAVYLSDELRQLVKARHIDEQDSVRKHVTLRKICTQAL